METEETMRERPKVHSLVHSPEGYNKQHWIRSKLGALNSFLLSLVLDSALEIGLSSSAFASILTTMWTGSRTARPQFSTIIWDANVASDGLAMSLRQDEFPKNINNLFSFIF